MDVARYLVELRAAAAGDAVPAIIAAVRRRTANLAGAGEPIRVVRVVYVPEDDAWLLVIEAPAVADVERLIDPHFDVVSSITPALTRSVGEVGG